MIMEHLNDPMDQESNQFQDEQMRADVARRSAEIYLSIAFGSSLLFFLLASLIGSYPTVAKIGGMVWVGMLSFIISMPIITARVKKKLQQ
jgi:putative flippase GtrA